MNHVKVEVLLGKTLTKIVNVDNDKLIFETSDGNIYKMYHEQDCCEYVSIEEIIGDLNDLLGEPLLMAEEKTEYEDSIDASETFTFYKFATIKGYVTIRWYGSSNGYYSETVDFVHMLDYSGGDVYGIHN